MTLWPEEYEGIRDEARATALAIAEMFGAGGPAVVPTDRDERVRAQREMMKPFEAVSPAGADRDIAGVPCRVFRPERPARAVYLHFHGGAMILGSPADERRRQRRSGVAVRRRGRVGRLPPRARAPAPRRLRRRPGGRAVAGGARRERVRHRRGS